MTCPIDGMCEKPGCAVPEHEDFRQHIGEGFIRIYCSERKKYIKITTNDLFVED